MKTIRLDGNDQAHCEQAGAMLKAGKLVAVPTETVYGLAADAMNPAAVERIFEAKGRPSNHPLIVHIGDIGQLDTLAREIPPIVPVLTEHFWPGPLTLLLNKKANVPDTVTGGLDTVGIRMPDHPVTLALLRHHNLMVAAPSANPYKRLSPTSAEQVASGLDGKIDGILDGGACHVGLESTIVDLTEFNQSGDIVIRRTGHITAEEISEVLQLPVQAWQPHDKAVPGNVSAHYQPSCKLLVKTTDQLKNDLQKDSGVSIGVMSYSDALNTVLAGYPQYINVTMHADKTAYARMLYAALYQLDKRGVDEIWLEAPPVNNEWLDVNDRLARAKSKVE